MPKLHPIIDRRQGMGTYRIMRKSQARTHDAPAMAIEAFVIVCVLTLFGCCLYAFVARNAQGFRMMWKYRDLDGMDPKVTSGMRWTWWLFATPKQRDDMARMIEATRKTTGYYEKHAENDKLPWPWEYVFQFFLWAVLAFWLYWSISDWIWAPASAETVAGADRFFCVSGMCMVTSMACCGVEYLAGVVLKLAEGPQVDFFMAWLITASRHIKNAMPIIASANGFCILWNSFFTDEEIFSGPEVMVWIIVFLAAFIMMHYPNGMSEADQRVVARARSNTTFGWYDEGDAATLKAEYWEAYEETASELEEKAATQPLKLTKAQRKALGKERETRREAERLAQKKRDRQEAKEQKARARAMQATVIRRAAERAGLPYEERPALLSRLQVAEGRYTRAIASAEIARRKLEQFDHEHAGRIALLDQEKAEILARLGVHDSSSGSGSDEGSGGGGGGEGEGGSNGPSHSDHVDSADLAAQTLRNKEEAERRRRVREQREKEKAEQKEKEYSEAGPSHKEGAPKWEAPAPDEGEKAKREAEKQASLLRKQEQQKERVKEKEAQEKRESERLQNLKTGRRILQGNAHNRAGSHVQRSSLQPLREDEPEPTLTLADVALGFHEDPRFQMQDDDLESVATTAVDPMLTHHAEERTEEREYAEHQIKHTKKYGRVEPGNKPGTYVHYPCREGDPKLVTNSEGTVLTVI